MPRNLYSGTNDLESFCIKNNRTDLLEEWDYKMNSNLRPNMVCYGTAKKVWWIGKCGHSYEASINKRTSDKTGCPYCCDSHAKLLRGFNDLAVTNPEVLQYWDYEKNDTLTPSDVMKGQHIKVWWKCEIGHSYEMTIYHKVQGRRCPVCRRESQTSFPEQALLYYIMSAFPDTLPSYRGILGGKELDIYIPSIQTAIEFDGAKWHKDVNKDVKKNELCLKEGIKIIRIRDSKCPSLPKTENVQVIEHTDYSDEELIRCIQETAKELRTEFDIDLNRDRSKIYNHYLTKKKEKSLAESFPELCEEWNYKRNGETVPQFVTGHSMKKVWWIGKCGHEWQAVVASRVKGHGCPFCNSNRLLPGFNDLQSVYPDLAKVFDEEKNELSVSMLSPYQQRSYYWKCSRGHSYRKNLKTMIKNLDKIDIMCPLCKDSSAYKSSKSLTQKTPWKVLELTIDKTNPEVLVEWDYDRNVIAPRDITVGSEKKVWWKCLKGHSYEATPNNHIVLHRGCPYCAGRKVLKGYNDIESQNPRLAKEWDYDRNEGITPDKVVYGGKEKYWWKCSKGHVFKTSVGIRKLGCGCPYCSTSQKRAVKNLDTGEIFLSLNDAAKSCNLKVGDTISLCCKGKQKKAGGYRWEYYQTR